MDERLGFFSLGGAIHRWELLALFLSKKGLVLYHGAVFEVVFQQHGRLLQVRLKALSWWDQWRSSLIPQTPPASLPPHSSVVIPPPASKTSSKRKRGSEDGKEKSEPALKWSQSKKSFGGDAVRTATTKLK